MANDLIIYRSYFSRQNFVFHCAKIGASIPTSKQLRSRSRRISSLMDGKSLFPTNKKVKPKSIQLELSVNFWRISWSISAIMMHGVSLPSISNMTVGTRTNFALGKRDPNGIKNQKTFITVLGYQQINSTPFLLVILVAGQLIIYNYSSITVFCTIRLNRSVKLLCQTTN